VKSPSQSFFSQARAVAPCILFIDQIDTLVSKRGSTSSSENTGDRIVTCFLTEMDGLFSRGSAMTHEHVMVIGATSRKAALDMAILRPGRLDQHIHIPLPNIIARREILLGFAKKMSISWDTAFIDTIARDTEGWTGADLENLLREAAMLALREQQSSEPTTIETKHIMQVMLSVNHASN